MGYAWEIRAVWPASPEQICQMTARLPRLAEAGGRPELDLALWRGVLQGIGQCAGGRMYWPKPLGRRFST